jgi:hypothetical protein
MLAMKPHNSDVMKNGLLSPGEALLPDEYLGSTTAQLHLQLDGNLVLR